MTAEMLAFKVLNRDITKVWIDWAVEMLMAGYETESLTILAGELEPYNQFEMHSLTSKVLDELNLDYSNKEQVIKNYVCYIIDKGLNGKLDKLKTLETLKDICIELDYEKSLFHFYTLYFAKDDLNGSDCQYYLEGANKSNIDKIIDDYFISWRLDCLNKGT